jgi:hypothetical protein
MARLHGCQRAVLSRFIRLERHSCQSKFFVESLGTSEILKSSTDRINSSRQRWMQLRNGSTAHLLNGEPVEVMTTVNAVFTLGNSAR